MFQIAVKSYDKRLLKSLYILLFVHWGLCEGTAASPENKMFCCWKHRHIYYDFGKYSDCGQRIVVKNGNSTDKFKYKRIGLSQTKDSGIGFADTFFLFIDKIKTDFQFYSLFTADSTINGSLYLFDRMFAVFVDKGCCIKSFTWVIQNILDNGLCS